MWIPGYVSRNGFWFAARKVEETPVVIEYWTALGEYNAAVRKRFQGGEPTPCCGRGGNMPLNTSCPTCIQQAREEGEAARVLDDAARAVFQSL